MHDPPLMPQVDACAAHMRSNTNCHLVSRLLPKVKNSIIATLYLSFIGIYTFTFNSNLQEGSVRAKFF